MNKKLKILTYGIIVLLAGSIAAVLVYSDRKQEQVEIQHVEVDIRFPQYNRILSREEIADIIRAEKERLGDKISIGQLEKKLNENAYIRKAEVYASVNGGIKANVQLREPVARIYEKGGSSYYIDEKGHPFPLKNGFSARILPVNGEWHEPYALRKGFMDLDSVKSRSLLDDAAFLTGLIRSNPFRNALFDQVYVNEKKEFELIPKIGQSLILFGDTSNAEGKFRKLEIFYREGLAYTGFNDYRTINLKYKNQIICKR